MRIAFIVIGIFLVLFIFILLFFPFLKRKYELHFHQRLVYKKLYKFSLNYDDLLINEVKIKNGEEDIYFDHILFGKKYIYCIKDISYPLGIEGESRDNKWFCYDAKGSFSYIENPLRKNFIELELLKVYLHVPKDQNLFFPICVINDECDFNVHEPVDGEAILKKEDLEKFLKEKEMDENVNPINPEKLEKFAQNLYAKCENKKEVSN